MSHPYAELPDAAFWRRAVSGLDPEAIDPVGEPPFRIGPTDRVATAGSCFAQHLARAIAAEGFTYLVTEPWPGSAGAEDESYGVFSARFGNLYTVAQLSQLFERAYGLFEPADSVWRRSDGAFVDPFRPRIQAGGFRDADALRADREAHLAAVRAMVETCEVFVFTLGQTECWAAEADGAVVPLAPGVAGAPLDGATYGFRNLGVDEMRRDLTRFIDRLRTVNPGARVVLTVSPVPMVATYAPRHVCVSTGYSKAALRVTAELACAERPGVAYFPSYEVITGPASAGRWFEPDRRNVSPAGVAHVMRLFSRHYLSRSEGPGAPVAAGDATPDRDSRRRVEALRAVICDEEAVDP